MRKILIVVILILIIPITGCVTTFKCVTGKKGQRLADENISAPATAFLMLPELDKVLSGEDVNTARRDSHKAEKQMDTEKDKIVSYDKLDGEEYIIKTGESKKQILNKYGEPLRKVSSKEKGSDESWEYRYFTIHFKRNRVRGLSFHKAAGVYYSRDDGLPNFFDIPDEAYYKGSTAPVAE